MDSPAFNAGIVTGSKIVAVGGTAYDADGFRKAITAAKAGGGIERWSSAATASRP